MSLDNLSTMNNLQIQKSISQSLNLNKASNRSIRIQPVISKTASLEPQSQVFPVVKPSISKPSDQVSGTRNLSFDVPINEEATWVADKRQDFHVDFLAQEEAQKQERIRYYLSLWKEKQALRKAQEQTSLKQVGEQTGFLELTPMQTRLERPILELEDHSNKTNVQNDMDNDYAPLTEERFSVTLPQGLDASDSEELEQADQSVAIRSKVQISDHSLNLPFNGEEISNCSIQSQGFSGIPFLEKEEQPQHPFLKAVEKIIAPKVQEPYVSNQLSKFNQNTVTPNIRSPISPYASKIPSRKSFRVGEVDSEFKHFDTTKFIERKMVSEKTNFKANLSEQLIKANSKMSDSVQSFVNALENTPSQSSLDVFVNTLSFSLNPNSQLAEEKDSALNQEKARHFSQLLETTNEKNALLLNPEIARKAEAVCQKIIVKEAYIKAMDYTRECLLKKEESFKKNMGCIKAQLPKLSKNKLKALNLQKYLKNKNEVK